MQFLIPMSLIAFHSNYTMLIVSIMVLCGGQATMGLCMFIIPGESVPKRLMTTASSLPNFVGEVIGGSIGGIVAGYLGDKFGLTAAMIFASVVLLGSFILGLAYKESHAKFAKENLMEDRAS